MNVKQCVYLFLVIGAAFGQDAVRNKKALELSFLGGYAIAVGRTGDPDDLGYAYSYNDDRKEVYFSGGRGSKGVLQLGLRTEIGIEPLISATFSYGYGPNLEESQGQWHYRKRAFLFVGPGIGVLRQNGKWTYGAGIIPGVLYPWSEDLTEYPGQVPASHLKMLYRPGFGVGSYFSSELKVKKPFSFHFELRPLYAFSEVKRIIAESGDDFRYETVYLRDTENLPEDIPFENGGTKVYRHGGQRVSFSGIALLFGITMELAPNNGK